MDAAATLAEAVAHQARTMTKRMLIALLRIPAPASPSGLLAAAVAAVGVVAAARFGTYFQPWPESLIVEMRSGRRSLCAAHEKISVRAGCGQLAARRANPRRPREFSCAPIRTV